MHPAEEITGTRSSRLRGKKILVCVTGSIACVETVHLVREIKRHEGEPIVALSEAAERLVSPETLEWATGKPPIIQIRGQVEHVSLATEPGKVDICLVIATTNTICKVANGIADTTTTLLIASMIGAKIPVVMIPVAHQFLLDNPITIEAIQYLKNLAVLFLSPRYEEEKAKFPKISDIMDKIFEVLDFPKLLSGRHLMITAGGTREFVDQVRFISNPSSGKTGLALAQVARNLGAEVTIILGAQHSADFQGFNVVNVTSAEEMTSKSLELIQEQNFDMVISSAAISDFTLDQRDEKIRSGQPLELTFRPTRKLIKEIKHINPNLPIIGFKAEVNCSDEELAQKAKLSMTESNLSLVVANDISRTGSGFSTDTNEVVIFRGPGDWRSVKGPKLEISREIMAEVVKIFDSQEVNS